jgi:hypothetical protein
MAAAHELLRGAPRPPWPSDIAAVLSLASQPLPRPFSRSNTSPRIAQTDHFLEIAEHCGCHALRANITKLAMTLHELILVMEHAVYTHLEKHIETSAFVGACTAAQGGWLTRGHEAHAQAAGGERGWVAARVRARAPLPALLSPPVLSTPNHNPHPPSTPAAADHEFDHIEDQIHAIVDLMGDNEDKLNAHYPQIQALLDATLPKIEAHLNSMMKVQLPALEAAMKPEEAAKLVAEIKAVQRSIVE